MTPSCSAYHVFTQVENLLNQKTYIGRLKHCPTTEPSCALVKDLGPWVKIPPLLPIQIPRILIWKPDNGESILIPFYSAAPVARVRAHTHKHTHTHTHTHTHSTLLRFTLTLFIFLHYLCTSITPPFNCKLFNFESRCYNLYLDLPCIVHTACDL